MFDLNGSLRSTIFRRRVTLLGVGPMSLTVTNEAIRLANEYRTHVALIPSRRQVDAAHLGGGYVEGWSTAQFADYVRSIDQGGFALLSRDHSGPWQGSSTQTLSFPDAMLESKASLEDDIASGFNLLHIDPSPALSKGFSEKEVTEMAVELIAHCVAKMGSENRCVFEVGTDEQDTAPDPLSLTEKRIDDLFRELDRFNLPRPLFYVAQTGTKVLETRNFGSFDQPFTVEGSLPATVFLPELLDLIRRKGLLLKEHNADYLSNGSLKWHRKFGIHAANVAPEFGVTETRCLLALLEQYNLENERDLFKEIVLAGKNWSKWLAPESTASERDKVDMAGHYHFADPRVIEIRQTLARTAALNGLDSESFIASKVRESIDRYLRAFGYGAGR
jgi:hypothetical protein